MGVSLVQWLAVAALFGLVLGGDDLQDFFSASSYEYTLNLDLDAAGSTGFSGEAILNLQTAKEVPWNTTSIVVSASLLEPTEVTVFHPSKRREEVVLTSIKKDRRLETLAIPVREMVTNSSSYILRILYTGKYNSTGGLFRSTYNNRNFVSTQLYPSYSRRVFISLDKPGNVVPIKLTVKTNTASKDVKVYTGLDQAAVSGGTQLTTKKNIPLSALFFTAGPYKQLSGIPFWYPDGWAISALNFFTVTDILGAAHISALYKAVNISAKVVAVPGLPVASESGLGMTALSMDLAYERSEFSNYELKEKAIKIISAVVKSIYATLVSPRTWNDIWISESTALYIAQKVLPNLTRWKDMKGITPDILNIALSKTWSSDSMPVRPNFTSTEQVVAYLKDPAVAKGAVILGMVDSLRPDDDLLAFTTYLKDRQGKSVTTDDFLGQLADYKQLNQTDNFPSGQTLQDILKPWLSQSGYPALILERRDTDILASEMRYGPQNMSDKSGWTLPIQYQRVSNASAASNDGPESAWLVPGPNAQVTLEKGLDSFSTILLNTQSTGLYRTLYDAGDLSVLANILSDSRGSNIKPSWRANILRDALAFAKSGQLGYSSLIDFLMYLSGERDMEPWVATISGLRELWMYIYFTDLKLQFENVFGDLMRPTFASLRFNNMGIVTGMLMRSLVSAHCDFGDQDCLDETRASFINYVNGKQPNIASDLIPVIYCNGLRGITNIDELMTYVTKQYNSSLSEYSKKNVFSYLACPGDNSTMNSYLTNILIRPVVESMPPEDMVMAFEEVASRPEHLDLSFSFVVRNFAGLNRALKEEHKIRLIKILGERGSTEAHVEVLTGFTFGNSSAMASAVSDALKQVKERQKFISDNYRQIETGLYGRPVGPTQPTPPGTDSTDTSPSGSPKPTPTPEPNGAERASITALAGALLATLALLAR